LLPICQSVFGILKRFISSLIQRIFIFSPYCEQFRVICVTSTTFPIRLYFSLAFKAIGLYHPAPKRVQKVCTLILQIPLLKYAAGITLVNDGVLLQLLLFAVSQFWSLELVSCMNEKIFFSYSTMFH